MSVYLDEKYLNLLEKSIKKSGLGIELWFSLATYNLRVVNGKMSFQEYFISVLKDALSD